MNSEPLSESMPRKAKGQRLAQLLECLLHHDLALSQDGGRLDPAGVDNGGTIGPGAAVRLPRGARRRSIEQPDGVFAMRPRDVAELIQDAPLPRPRRVPIPLIDRLHVLSLALRTHDGSLHRLAKVSSPTARRSPLGNILDGAIRLLDPSPSAD